MSELTFTKNYPMMLIIPNGIWKLSLPIEARILSSNEIIGYCRTPSPGASMSLEDLDQIFQSTPTFELQIQHDYEHLDTPIFSVLLAKVHASGTGIELSFQLNENCEAYDDLLSELSN